MTADGGRIRTLPGRIPFRAEPSFLIRRFRSVNPTSNSHQQPRSGANWERGCFYWEGEMARGVVFNGGGSRVAWSLGAVSV